MRKAREKKNENKSKEGERKERKMLPPDIVKHRIYVKYSTKQVYNTEFLV